MIKERPFLFVPHWWQPPPPIGEGEAAPNISVSLVTDDYDIFTRNFGAEQG